MEGLYHTVYFFSAFCVHVVLFMKGLPVSTLAEAMFLDAWDYHTKRQSTQRPEEEGATAEGSNTINIFYDNDIYRICRK